jgi:hypothetical protein
VRRRPDGGLIDPVGDADAYPFAIHENLVAGNVRDEGGVQRVWQSSELFADLRSPHTGGACTKCAHFEAGRSGFMAAKFFTGLPLDRPDPECVEGYGEAALAGRDAGLFRRAARWTTRTPDRPAAADAARDPGHACQALRRIPVGRSRGPVAEPISYAPKRLNDGNPRMNRPHSCSGAGWSRGAATSDPAGSDLPEGRRGPGWRARRRIRRSSVWRRIRVPPGGHGRPPCPRADPLQQVSGVLFTQPPSPSAPGPRRA